MKRVLIVDDSKEFCQILSSMLDSKGIDSEDVNSGEDALEKIKNHIYDLLLVDLKMPGMSGIELLKKVRDISPSTLVIIMTAYGTIENAVDAMKNGAFDYILKPFSGDEVGIKINNAMEHKRLLAKNQELEDVVKTRYGTLIGSSEGMSQVYKLIDKVAPTDSALLITGMSGTGKTHVAREIHQRSNRRGAPFVIVNCVSFSKDALEREIFGYEKGSFEGALSRVRGKLEVADGGIVFFDEISEVDVSTQIKLVRFLETRTFKRLGGSEDIKANDRVIASTSKDLSIMVKEGKFREDLFYRLGTFSIGLPNLDERGEDIFELASSLLMKSRMEQNKTVKLSNEVIEIFRKYEWPGNIRELENIISQAVILADGEYVLPVHLPAAMLNAVDYKGEMRPKENNLHSQMNAIESEMIREALEATGWNQIKASAKLGYKRTSLQYKMKKYGLMKKKSLQV